MGVYAMGNLSVCGNETYVLALSRNVQCVCVCGGGGGRVCMEGVRGCVNVRAYMGV